MTKQVFDDETLMAFADNELDAATSAKVEAALATDDDLVNRLVVFTESRAMAKDGLEPLLNEPVPAALQTKIEKMVEAANSGSQTSPVGNTEKVVAFSDRIDRTAQKQMPSWALPLAASIALFIGVGSGYLIGVGEDRSSQSGSTLLSSLSNTSVLNQLDSLPSGSEINLAGGQERVRAIASFRDSNGTFCREFEYDQVKTATAVAVACHQDNAWTVSFAVLTGPTDDSYAPASSLEALTSYLDDIGAEDPLSDEKEKEALEALK
ncbi:MAG: anti-sigma factor [Stappiaceae bacterium]